MEDKVGKMDENGQETVARDRFFSQQKGKKLRVSDRGILRILNSACMRRSGSVNRWLEKTWVGEWVAQRRSSSFIDSFIGSLNY